MMGDRWTPEEIAHRKRELEGTGEGRRELEEWARKRMDEALAEVNSAFLDADLLPEGMHVEWDFAPLLGVVDGDRPAFTDDEDERR